VDNAKYLIDLGADVNARNNNNGTPLHDACLAVARYSVELLLDHGADARLRNNDNNTPMDFYRREREHREAILRVTYPIHWKIRDKLDDEVKRMVLEDGVDVNIRDNDLGEPLHTAIEESRFDLARWLMGHGADLFAMDKLFKRPFDFFKNMSVRREFLIDTIYGYDLLTANSNALWFYYIQEEDLPGTIERVTEYVLEYPNLADVLDDHGRSAVHMACPEAKQVILSTFLWHDRYRIIDARPEHTSATCFVFKALDELDLDDQRKPRKVGRS
jgi:ankyrin repeat protein